MIPSHTEQFFKLISSENGLSGSHLRVLCVLREINASCGIIAKLTGLSKRRVEQRVAELVKTGKVTRYQTRGDGTHIYSLASGLGRSSSLLVSYPLEGQQIRKLRNGETTTAAAIDGLRKPQYKQVEVNDEELLTFIGEE